MIKRAFRYGLKYAAKRLLKRAAGKSSTGYGARKRYTRKRRSRIFDLFS